jgi:quinol monooxygenase YgiN
MKRGLVRYNVKADRAAENEAYFKQVFEELRQTSPGGIRYATFKLDDGVRFVHLPSIETEDGGNPLGETTAFKAFQADIGDRCDEPPVAVNLNEVGSYRLFGG